MKKPQISIINQQNRTFFSVPAKNTHSSLRANHIINLINFLFRKKRRIPTGLSIYLKTLMLAYCILMPVLTQAKETGTYELSLSFMPEIHELTGTARITVPPGKGLQLFLGQIRISGSLLKTEDGTEYILSQQENTIVLEPHQKQRVLFLSYTYNASHSRDNLISNKGISLTNNWFPVPAEPLLFSITAELPDHFSAIVEADVFPLSKNGNYVKAVYSRPATALHLNAGPYILERLQVRDSFYVYTMFFKEDSELASGYLQTAKNYLLKYEKEIGPFPYNHYVIVANRMPTGYGMPTFTLLGQMLLPLPFIRNGSLGHEIVHSWFGNSVEVDPSSGNWCEGLTAFLSDQRLREEQGDGIGYRKEAITKYLNYATATSPLTLDEFTSASHDQVIAETKRAVGYNRGTLFFNELREKLGEAIFRKGIQRFYNKNIFSQASWEDLRRSFEFISGVDLGLFFKERLSRKDIPRLSIKNVDITYAGSTPELTFDLIQETEQPYNLFVPIHVKTSTGITKTTRDITARSTTISIQLKQRPLMFTIDPELSFLRELSADEVVPVWSHFLGSDKKLVILATDESREKYDVFLKSLNNYQIEIVSADEVTNADLGKNSLLFLDASLSPAQSLFGEINHPSQGFTLDTRINPLNREHVAVLVTSADKNEVSEAANKLNHYGKYSYLKFSHGRNRKKTTEDTSNGIRFVIDSLPDGNSTERISSFDHIVRELAKKQIVYVGENHTSLSDHLLQLRLIEALHRLNPNIAIGMEMFPESSQAALDKYILHDATMNEQAFLKESGYFDVWRFDYRYYRDILNYAKNNRLPVIALNIDRKVVSQVFKDGNTDGLDKAVSDSLPSERDLGLPGYAERLEEMYSFHSENSHAAGLQSGFIQAQAIWDETMAENIASFIKDAPDHTMIILAGSQHTRNDSGIPPRVSRRVNVDQASVLNIYSNSTSDNLKEVADYYFFYDHDVLPETPRIGIVLGTVTTTESGPRLVIEQLSPHGKAGEAGLLAGDILLKVKGFAVRSMSDLQIAMLDSRAGDKITLEVEREGGSAKLKLSFAVELTQPQSLEAHP